MEIAAREPGAGRVRAGVSELTFRKESEPVGVLRWENGKWSFVGEVEESAKSFLLVSQGLIDQYIAEKLQEIEADRLVGKEGTRAHIIHDAPLPT